MAAKRPNPHAIHPSPRGMGNAGPLLAAHVAQGQTAKAARDTMGQRNDALTSIPVHGFLPYTSKATRVRIR